MPSMGITRSFISWPDLSTWAWLTHDYNQRAVKYNSDGLAAFAGVLEAMNRSFPGGFYYALPEMYLDLALPWQPTSGIRRRSVEGSIHKVEFSHELPSWSWVGWSGSLDDTAWSGNHDCIRSDRGINLIHKRKYSIKALLRFHKRSSKLGEHWEIVQTYTEHRNLLLDQTLPLPRGWTKKQESEGDVFYTHGTIDDATSWHPIPLASGSTADVGLYEWMPHLYFQAERAWLQIGWPYEPEGIAIQC